MKKLFLVAAFVLTALLPAKAFEFPGFEWEVGAEVTSKYLWRGLNLGGLSFQPTASVGYGGAKVEVWANIGANNRQLDWFNPELDVTLSYTLKGVWISLNHQYYFDHQKYFDYKNGNSQLELSAGVDFRDLIETIGLRFEWHTYVAGDDYRPVIAGESDLFNANGTARLNNEGNAIALGDTIGKKRAYSSYIEIAYKFGLPLGFSLTPIVGITPWKSMYTNYEGKAALNHLGLRADFDFEFANHFALNVYAQVSMNTYKMSRTNIFSEVGDWYQHSGVNSSRMNFAIGAGIWIF